MNSIGNHTLKPHINSQTIVAFLTFNCSPIRFPTQLYDTIAGIWVPCILTFYIHVDDGDAGWFEYLNFVTNPFWYCYSSHITDTDMLNPISTSKNNPFISIKNMLDHRFSCQLIRSPIHENQEVKNHNDRYSGEMFNRICNKFFQRESY